jgi:uncharacterized membrane protein HdeD (DUF308 family)
MNASRELYNNTTSEDARTVAGEIGRWWWAWIVVGVLWILAAFVILQFNRASVETVAIIIGVMLLAAGIQEIVIGVLSDGWKWLWYIFGALCIIGGLVALFRRAPTVLIIASVLGILFLVIGVFWILQALATTRTDNLWWLGLIAGILMLGLGFWISWQSLATQAYTLLVFAGLWALLHGITDIVKAFQVKRLGGLPAVA